MVCPQLPVQYPQLPALMIGQIETLIWRIVRPPACQYWLPPANDLLTFLTACLYTLFNFILFYSLASAWPCLPSHATFELTATKWNRIARFDPYWSRAEWEDVIIELGTRLLFHFLYKRGAAVLRDWSLITGRGGLQNGKNRGSETFCAPPSRQGKTFCAPPFKDWKLLAPPYNMAKTSSY